jgi:hypothetical protein
LMCREKKKKKKLFLSLCVFFSTLCICVRCLLRVKFWFCFFENLRVGVGVEVERKCLIFGTRK